MKKKVIVFGASGTIGQQIVDQAKNDYEVSAFCRNPSKVHFGNGVKILTGDVTSFQDVNHAIADHDIVIVALGSGSQRTGTVRSVGTKNIIDAMHANGIKRLICQTTLGCGESRGNLNFFWKNIMFGWYLKGVFQDHEVQEKYVRESKLDWTLVRPAAFTNGKQTGNYKHGFQGDEKKLTLTISRADVADFIIRQLDDLNYLRKSPGLSY